MSVTLSKTSKQAPLLLYNGFAYTIDRKTDQKIYWKCEHARKLGCRARLHTSVDHVVLKTVGEHENHTGDPRTAPIRKYYEQLYTESQQNHTSPHNILTQTNIGVPDEVRVHLPATTNLKRNIRRWRQEENVAPTPIDTNFPMIPEKFHITARGSSFLRKDTGPGNQRILIFFSDQQKEIMENSTVSDQATILCELIMNLLGFLRGWYVQSCSRNILSAIRYSRSASRTYSTHHFCTL